MPTPHDENHIEKEQDLHATEDSIRADLERLSLVESAKKEFDPKDPEVDSLSTEAVDLADGISRKTRAEQQLGQELG
jgi:hypothetical protein